MSEIALIGGIISGVGQIASGVAANRQAQQQALNEEAAGKQEFANAQQLAFQKKKEGQMMLARQQALAAASGGGADDPTILKIMGDTANQSALNVRQTVAGGRQNMENAFSSARNIRKSGQSSFLGSLFNAAGTSASAGAKYKGY